MAVNGNASAQTDVTPLRPAERRPRSAYPPEVRALVDAATREGVSDRSELRALVRAEHRLEVPEATIGAWQRELRRREPIDRPALLRSVADRASALLSEEITRQERLPSHKRDLARLDQAVRTLKTLDGIGPSKQTGAPQTLSDLSGPSSER